MSQDEEHLNLLSIFHYVFGGLVAFFGFLPLLYAGIGGTVIFASQPKFFNAPDNVPATWIGGLFLVFGVAMFLIAEIIALCLTLSGRFISKRTHYSFNFVVACLQCFCFPFGTALGIFTLIVLVRPSVKTLFGCGPTLPPPTPPAL